MSQRIDVVAHIQALPGEESAVREVLESYIAPTRQEEGCLRYDLFVDIEDPAKFTFIEEWVSAEALEQHRNAPHMMAGRPKLNGRVAGTTWVQRLVRIA